VDRGNADGGDGGGAGDDDDEKLLVNRLANLFT
jgi:hypothetical protein